MAPLNTLPLIVPFTAEPGPLPIIWPLEAFSWFISCCIIVAVTPDRFCGDAMKVAIALAMPLVPAFAGIIVLVPMPPIITPLPDILPFITPSDASFIIAVTMADDDDMPWLWAYCDMPASAMP